MGSLASKVLGKPNGLEVKTEKTKLKRMYRLFSHLSSESLEQYIRKIAGKCAFPKTDF